MTLVQGQATLHVIVAVRVWPDVILTTMSMSWSHLINHYDSFRLLVRFSGLPQKPRKEERSAFACMLDVAVLTSTPPLYL